MTIQLPPWLFPAGVTLLGISLVIHKLANCELNLASFISGAVVGAAVVIVGTYVVVASQTGASPTR